LGTHIDLDLPGCEMRSRQLHGSKSKEGVRLLRLFAFHELRDRFPGNVRHHGRQEVPGFGSNPVDVTLEGWSDRARRSGELREEPGVPDRAQGNPAHSPLVHDREALVEIPWRSPLYHRPGHPEARVHCLLAVVAHLDAKPRFVPFSIECEGLAHRETARRILKDRRCIVVTYKPEGREG